MLSFTFLILVLNPLLFFTHIVHGIPSKDIQGDLTALSNRLDELTKDSNRKNRDIERLEAALNVQINTNEEQWREIANLKLKVERLESRLDISNNVTFKNLTELFKKDERTMAEGERMAELVKEVGVKWIDGNDILRYGPDALIELCFFYNGDNLLDIIKFFLSTGVDVNHTHRKEGANILLFLTVRRKDNLLDPSQFLEIFKLLISSGINLNYKVRDNVNVLHLLSEFYPIDNLLDIFKLLLSNGADINSTDKQGKNIFYYLSRNEDKSQNVLELIQFLISSGIEVHHKDEDKNNALHHFARRCSRNLLEIIKLLISAGVDVTATNENGDNALILVIAEQPYCRYPDFLEIIKLLISNGIDVNHENNEGKKIRDIMENSYLEEGQDKQAAMKLLE